MKHRVFSTDLTGNTAGVLGQPKHENSQQTGWQSSCFCVRILHVFFDFCDFENICQTRKKNGHLLPTFQRPRQLNHAISELVFKAKVFWIFVKNRILYTTMLSYSVSFVFLAAQSIAMYTSILLIFIEKGEEVHLLSKM